ncbi:lipid II-degrading bacteriocin [Comamonas sp. JUb58]|uniref:lipid II-degrading bacteriocin n=1 Tax=Comamonas sp. JUb58 TaxID=2485114 RepID=UPI00105CB957|nr:lipid II-degrading bacteriocin [Comamonas sp. JUb58]TDS70824.1 colicin M-like protein [Comamonas sp. JUb58]
MTLSKRNFLMQGSLVPLTLIGSAKADPTLPEVVVEAPQPFFDVDPSTDFFIMHPRSPMHSDQMKRMLYTQNQIDSGKYFENWALSCLRKDNEAVLKEITNGAAILVNVNKGTGSPEVMSTNEATLQTIIVSASPTFAQQLTGLIAGVMQRTPFLPFAGIWLYASGVGAEAGTVVLDIRNLGINPKLQHIGPPNNTLSAFIENNKAIAGDYEYHSGQFGYDTANDGFKPRFIIGNVSALVDGTLSVSNDGSWSFRGEIGFFNDIYDGGGSSSHRNDVDNAMTNILDRIPGSQYEIEIKGRQPFTINGK